MDLYHYLRYHNRKLYTDDFAPRPFAYGIRRVGAPLSFRFLTLTFPFWKGHHPEGVVSIEADLKDGTMAEPIQT